MDVCHIGLRLRNARALRCLSAETLGIGLGVSRSTVERYEAGRVIRPQLKLLRQAAKLLSVDVCWLMGEDTMATPVQEERLYLDALESPISVQPVPARVKPVSDVMTRFAGLEL